MGFRGGGPENSNTWKYPGMPNSSQKYYVGCDVSDKETALCIVNNDGDIVRETMVPSEPDDIAAYFQSTDLTFERIGLEASSLSIWLCRALAEAGYPVICIETYKSSAFLAAQKMKTDRNDARGIAQMMRCGLYSEVHIKSDASQRFKMLLNNRRFLVEQRVDIENQIRGSLKVFGLKIGPVSERQYEARVRELITGDGELEMAVSPLLEQRAAGVARIQELEAMLATAAKTDAVCRLLMTAPGIGPLTALLYKAVIDDPTRFKRSRDVPAQLGLVPRKYASGETDYNGGITKAGDVMLRHHLYRAAATLTQNSARPCKLKEWGRNLRKRSSYKSSTVAVARKLSIILHRMWMDGAEFDWGPRQPKCSGEKRGETELLIAA